MRGRPEPEPAARPPRLPFLRARRVLRAAPRPFSWGLGAAVLLLAGGFALLARGVDLDELHAAALRLNGGVAFALLTVLPLAGFPVNVLHVAAGFRFGFAGGMALVALSILLQLLASHALVRCCPGWFARRFAGVRARLPPATHPTVCVFTLLLPGVPYFVQNYTLALIGVPLRTYLACCLPLHVLRAAVTVGLGHQGSHFSRAGLLLLAGYWLLVLTGAWTAYRRLRRQLAGPPPAADGPTPPA
jgi:uncharacterized membrane protein YdjX (TVP38/TMEM64 family)